MATPHVVGLSAYYLSIASGAKNLFASDSDGVNPGALLRFASNVGVTDGLAFYALGAIERLLGFGAKPSKAVTSLGQADIVNAITPDELKKLVFKVATKGVLSDVKGTPNLLIFNNATASLKDQ